MRRYNGQFEFNKSSTCVHTGIFWTFQLLEIRIGSRIFLLKKKTKLPNILKKNSHFFSSRWVRGICFLIRDYVSFLILIVHTRLHLAFTSIHSHHQHLSFNILVETTYGKFERFLVGDTKIQFVVTLRSEFVFFRIIFHGKLLRKLTYQ